MDKFLKAKFQGKRFDDHTLPLEVARDLAAYETLIIELAKYPFKANNPERQRLPKGFGANFQLHLERIEEGSTEAIVAEYRSPNQLMAHSEQYFYDARDMVNSCIAGDTPENFPRSLLNQFNVIGKSLRSDEKWFFSDNAVLTPQRRKELVLSVSRVYERDTELWGTIDQLDFKNRTFRLSLENNKSIPVPMDEETSELARQYAGRKRHSITAQVTGSFDSSDNLQKVTGVKSIEVQPNYHLASRFEAILSLHNGWYDGAGVAPDNEVAQFVADKFIEGYPEKISLPYIYPTPDGTILFEWDREDSPSMEFYPDRMEAEFHAFAPNNDIERTFSLSESSAWTQLFTFLSQTLQEIE